MWNILKLNFRLHWLLTAPYWINTVQSIFKSSYYWCTLYNVFVFKHFRPRKWKLNNSLNTLKVLTIWTIVHCLSHDVCVMCVLHLLVHYTQHTVKFLIIRMYCVLCLKHSVFTSYSTWYYSTYHYSTYYSSTYNT